ncbi:MAG: heme o synthase [Planctomycetota bacterium]
MLARLSAYLEMTKPRAMIIVWVTAAAGLFVARSGQPMDWALFLHLAIGVLTSGGGSIVLNQVLERRYDERMDRTKNRPLPAGKVEPIRALAFGIALSLLGILWLAVFVNAITAILSGLSIVTYVLLYTPLKRVTTLNTAVGAVPGAIPPMMGWSAEHATLDLEAGLLFAILFVWQFPHFLAIAWLHREDYERAGYSMLPRFDPSGMITGRQMVMNTALLWPLCLLPTYFGFTSIAFAFGATVLCVLLMGLSVVFAARRDDRSARWMLKGSVLHISLLMVAMVVDGLL